MPTLSESTIAELLTPYLTVQEGLPSKFSTYLDLLLRWNARTNLTAIRSPEEIVRRHFGESLFTGTHLGDPLPEALLDLGSGAGFPGLPIALLHPRIAVTLAESQNKKATFLREVVRSLDLRNVEVWAGRAEDLPDGRRFHTLTLRAVDNMAAALAAAAPRAERQIVLLTTSIPEFPAGFAADTPIRLPGSDSGVLLRALRS
ncbi:16S rRNA (guanine(527)-N(7))-methyltransferase RsmG [Edaphobacter aggregans]|uniref:16S rRNA (guanine(527)-N(7))-methyltransferase RsmG n=1 Tax=Edaphobacter aggregans TaxID=570835 RepID=UPI0005591267|nr:16S rRNA (guanine(527)-N(7))-methyltransferase RsmG [Edaphobacter aggregans]